MSSSKTERIKNSEPEIIHEVKLGNYFKTGKSLTFFFSCFLKRKTLFINQRGR